MEDISERERRTLQKLLDLINWRAFRIRRPGAQQGESLWAQKGHKNNPLGRSSNDQRRSTRCSERVAGMRDKGSDLQQDFGERATKVTSETGLIQKPCADLGGEDHPARTVTGVATALWSVSLGAVVLEALLLQHRNILPKNWWCSFPPCRSDLGKLTAVRR